jgi:hypothetical protein
MTVPVTAPARRAPWSAQATLTVLAVLIAGMWAAFTVSGVFFFATVVVAAVVMRGASAAAADAPRAAEKSDFIDLPDGVRRVVDDALRALPDGDARRQLLAVIVQARPILAARSTTFDAATESASRTNVESLVAACCGTALDLSRLDAVVSSKGGGPRDQTRDARLASARDMLAKRMSDATSALAALYTAGIEHGTPASNRVAELASEIAEDAKARGAAATELAQLLNER